MVLGGVALLGAVVFQACAQPPPDCSKVFEVELNRSAFVVRHVQGGAEGVRAGLAGVRARRAEHLRREVRLNACAGLFGGVCFCFLSISHTPQPPFLAAFRSRRRRARRRASSCQWSPAHAHTKQSDTPQLARDGDQTRGTDLVALTGDCVDTEANPHGIKNTPHSTQVC